MHLDYRQDLDEELARRAPRSPHATALPLTLPPGHENMWLNRTRLHLPWLGLVFSAGLHGAFIFGFNHPPVELAVASVAEVIEITFIDEEIEEEPEEIVSSDAEVVESLDSMSLPSLADIPTILPVDAFVQHVTLADMAPRKPDFGGVVTIPQTYRKGTRVTGKSLGDVFSLADLDRKPEARVQVAPQYPYAQNGKGLPAVHVVVGFIVDKEGNVVNAHLVSASHEGFEEAALSGVSRWKFRPGLRRGKVVNTKMEIPLIFRVIEE